MRSLLLRLLAIVLVSTPVKKVQADTQWAALKFHTQSFPEVLINNEIHEQVTINFFMAKKNEVPLDHKISAMLFEDMVSNAMDIGMHPIMDRYGYILLRTEGKIVIIYLEEKNMIVMRPAIEANYERHLVQPKSDSTAICFRSERVYNALLKLEGVAIPKDEMPLEKLERELKARRDARKSQR